MSSPSEPVNLIFLVWRRSPFMSSKPQTYVRSLRQYMRGPRFKSVEFAHHIRYPGVRTFLLVCFCVCFYHTIPRCFREPTAVQILISDICECNSASPVDGSPKKTVSALPQGPVEHPVFWRHRNPAGDSLCDIDVLHTTLIFVVFDIKSDGGRIDDFPRQPTETLQV